MAALLVVLPVSVALPWWLEHEDLSERGVVPPAPRNATDGTAELAGTRWEIGGMLLDEYGESEPPPEGTTLVDVAFRVTPSDRAASTRLMTCLFQVEDSQGRVWEPSGDYDFRTAVMETGAVLPGVYGCAGDDGELPAGEETAMLVSFLVPSEVAGDLTFEVRVDTGTGEDEEHSYAPVAAVFDAPDPE